MDEMKQRVPSDRLTRVCEYSKTWLEPTEAKAFALDLRDTRARIAELEELIEGERSLVEKAVRACKEAIGRRIWLMESRGSYEWDDDRFRSEFAQALNEAKDPLDKLSKVAYDRSNCPEATERARKAQAQAFRIAELEAALAAARKDTERRKWRPIDEIHEDHFPVLVADPREMSNTQFLMWIDDWHELEGQADYTLFHSLKPLDHEGYCPVLDAAIDAAKGEKG